MTLHTKTSSKPACTGHGRLVVALFILLSLGILSLDSWVRYRTIRTASTTALATPLPALSKDSPTGFEGGMRRLILPPVGTDGYQWIMHTQELLRQGGWRIRFTDEDNAPDGREMHWSHSLIWWLIVVGRAHSLITGWPLPASVEAVAPYANTLLLVFFILWSPWLVFRRFGAVAACAYTFSLVAVQLFFEFFMVGYPDHHGIADAACLMCSLFLAISGGGWVATAEPNGKCREEAGFPAAPSLRHARRNVVASALAGGVALWISAATVIPVLIGIGLAIMISFLLIPRGQRGEDGDYHPELWRLWGLAGGLASLFFYALEYFPAHMGMRLEVNHPLYALAWLCAGEVLTRLGRWRLRGEPPWSGRAGPVVLAGCAAGLLALPVLIKLDPERYFIVADPFLWKLHNEYILEFKNLIERVRMLGSQGVIMVMSVIMFVGIFILRFLFLKEPGRTWKTLLLLVFSPALAVTILGLLQVRWLGIAYGLWIAALPVWVACALSVARTRRFALWERAVVVLFFLALLVQYPHTLASAIVQTIGKGPIITSSDGFQMAVRELAYYFKRQAGGRDIVVLSGPTTTTWMMYYGGMKGIGTLYWENVGGLKAAASIYAARTDDEALQRLKERGVTDVAIFSMDTFSAPYAELIRDLPKGADPKDTFADNLLYAGKLPRWLTPLHFKMPKQFGKEWIALAEVRPEQTEAEGRDGVARWQAAKGRFGAAIEEFREAVRLNPGLKDAQLELAALLYLSEEPEEAAKHLDVGLAGASPDKVGEVCFTIATHCQDAGLHAPAVGLLRRAIEACPAVPSSRNLLAWLLATSRNDAVRKPEEALVLAVTNIGFFGRSAYFNTLAAAQAANSQFGDAVDTARQAVAAARKEGDSSEVVQSFEKRLKLYESGKPCLE